MARRRPRDHGTARCRDRPPIHDPATDRVGELHLTGGAGRLGIGLTNKYSEGYPGRRYYGGNQVIDEVEDLARDRAKALFGAEHANVQPHAGAIANLAVYQALLEPGDTVLAMSLDHGGHLTHGSPASITSKIWHFVSYGVTPASGDPDAPGETIDFDEVADVAKRERPS